MRLVRQRECRERSASGRGQWSYSWLHLDCGWFGDWCSDRFAVSAFCQNLGRFSDALYDRVWPRRATGNEDVHRDVLVQRTIECTAVDEDIGGRRARADRDHGLWSTN